MPYVNSLATRRGIVVAGKDVHLKHQHLEYENYTIPAGRYTISLLKRAGGKGGALVGIRSRSGGQGNWGNLDGNVDDGTGLWIDVDFFLEFFDFNPNKSMIVKDEFIFRRKDLRGMRCRTVGTLPDNKCSFVEFEENVDGCSADGLGKAGYCVIIPHKNLKEVEGKSTKKGKGKPLPEYLK